MTQIQQRLREYLDVKREREQLQHQLAELEAVLMHPRIQHLSDMPSNPVRGNPQEDMLVRHLELQELYSEKLAMLTEKQLAVEKLIEGLQPRHRTLMRYRYIEGLKWEEICVKMGYCWRQIHRLHSEALQALKAREGHDGELQEK